MTETSPEPVRHALLIRTALEVLAEDGGPVKRAEVLRRVGERVAFTPYEATQANSGDSLSRAETYLAFEATGMKAAGWINQTPEGWQVTDAGRAALVGHPDDGEGLVTEANQAYRESVQGAGGDEGPHYRPILEP